MGGKWLDCALPDAGWSSLAARRAHNPKVVGSNPAPATIYSVHDLVVMLNVASF